MEKYNPKEIEEKWQEYWKQHPELHRGDDNSAKEKKYILDMFPYPSGEGLHVGHVESYTATDIISRYWRMNGKNVLHPQGWDAFGLPAENFAVKTGTHPTETTKKAIATFTRQIDSMGFSYDWSREVTTSSPEYYKWTQWFFLTLYNNGLAYKKKAKVNWCPSCQTVLANEQVVDGKCERCSAEVIQKDLEQWFFKITDFIEDSEKTSGLLSGLSKVDWPEYTKSAQKNWIGRSEGAEFSMPIVGSEEKLDVYTTRVDTVFGMTYVVVAPEHSIILNLKFKISNYDEVEKYIVKARSKTELERTELSKEKTGVKLEGIEAVNPFTKEALPVFVADYVLGNYGTGAVMAVPAHDERDYEFAKKYNLPIKKVVEPKFVAGAGSSSAVKEGLPFVKRNAVAAIVKNPKSDEYLCIKWKKFTMNGLVTGGVEEGEDFIEAARREVHEETGYKNLKMVGASYEAIHSLFYHRVKNQNRWARFQYVFFELENEEKDEIKEEEKIVHDVVWIKKEELKNFFSVIEGEYIVDFIENPEKCFVDDGVVYNSGKYDWMDSAEAREKMTKWLEKEGIGKKKINYRLRDWLVSRQRYWGAPIPIIYCEKCGAVPVTEKDLPVLLPTDVDFKPTGESPLVYSKTFHDVQCPTCGEKARRESDTMDTFVCSSWYYLRYSDPKNSSEFASKEALKKWLPVDLYVGGAEHTVLHLLYARFFTKALNRLGYVEFDEPFLKLRHQGIILAQDGRKMSKSLGNVVNPDQVVQEFGADSLRMFEMFMGPLEDMKPWNTKGIVGIVRFLEKVWKLQSAVNSKLEANNKITALLHKTISRVTENIENMRYNTAISQMMILVNAMEKEYTKSATTNAHIRKEDYEKLILILAPFAPHITEEIWEKLGHKESIFLESWPKADSQLMKEDEIEMVVQVNGKLRDRIFVALDVTEDEAKKTALESEKVKIFTDGKNIRKIIFVPEKLINIVVE